MNEFLESVRYFFVGKYGFVRWGFWVFWGHVWWRIKNGFWVTDLYGLDVALAEWFAPRLRELAHSRQGCPMYYGLTAEQKKEEMETPNTHDPLFDKWTIDLLKASETLDYFLFYARDGGLSEKFRGDGQDRSKWDFDQEMKYRKEYAKILHWIADNIDGMWI